MKIFALVLFLLTYGLMLALPNRRPWIALCSAVLFIVSGVLRIGGALTAIDYNVLLMLAGTMGAVAFFIESGMPSRLAELLLQRVPNTTWAVVTLALFAGVISAFMDNVATLLIVAPIGMAISKELRISPVPVIISIAVSSNLQGAATLVGDTTSILLGGYAQMDFLDFFFMNGRLGIFWSVELGALATIPVLLFLFRKDKASVHVEAKTKVDDLFPTYLLCGIVAALIAASFIPGKPALTNGIICIAFCAAATIRACIRQKGVAPLKKALEAMDYETLLMLAGLFIVIEGVRKVGLIDDIAALIAGVAGNNVFLIYTIIVFASVLFSAFIDNIPYVASMLPVVQGIALLMGVEPYVLYFGLLTGATLGGNITPIGASANITGIGILRKNGYNVTLRDFLRIGVPFTMTAVLVGYAFIWLTWGM